MYLEKASLVRTSSTHAMRPWERRVDGKTPSTKAFDPHATSGPPVGSGDGRFHPTRYSIQIFATKRSERPARAPHPASHPRRFSRLRRTGPQLLLPQDASGAALDPAVFYRGFVRAVAQEFLADASAFGLDVLNGSGDQALGPIPRESAQLFFAMFSPISGVSMPGRRRDRRSWTILRGRFRRKGPF